MTDTPHAQDTPDTPDTRSVGRRTVLIATGTTAAALAVGAAAAPGAAQATTTTTTRTANAAAIDPAAVCSLEPAMEEGPFYLSGELVRSDVSEGKAGVPLKLALTVVNSSCTPLSNALVEIWSADALGEYSGYVGRNGHSEADDKTFLRGGVLTDSSGVANLTTIYPGWYSGRCVHVHVKVHTNVTLTSNGSFTGGTTVYTGQVFPPEAATVAVAKLSPYSTNTVTRTTLSKDRVFTGAGSSAGLLTLTALGSTTSAGYTGTITLGVNG